jgi:hypothetical protein
MVQHRLPENRNYDPRKETIDTLERENILMGVQ